MPNKLFRVHPRNYGKDSRRCRLCKNRRGIFFNVIEVWLDNMKWCFVEDVSGKIELLLDLLNIDEIIIFIFKKIILRVFICFIFLEYLVNSNNGIFYYTNNLDKI